MPTIGRPSVSPDAEPSAGASPKAKIPPVLVVSQ
jgi:hypothetical protein